MQLAGITHAESLKQPIPNGHSINWLLGHIVSSRSVPLERVKADSVWDEATRARYRHGSPPITQDAPDVLTLSDLTASFDLSHQRLTDGFASMIDAEFQSPSGYGNNTVIESLLYFHFHESYHVGQMTMIATALGYSAAYPI